MSWEVRTMRSATSSSERGRRFYPALWKKNMARFWPIWAVYALGWLVGLPLNLKGKVASLPASDTERVLKDLEGVVEYSANRNVFEGVINAGNVINHIASTVLSAAEIDHKGEKYSLFKYAFTPAVVHCIRKIAAERAAVIEAMGMTVHGNPTGMIDKVLHL